MRLGSLVCGLLINIYLMDFLYLQRDLQSRPCREILYIRCTRIMRVLFCVFCLSIHRRSPPPPPPPPPYTLQTIVLLLQVFFKDTLYFSLKYVLPQVLFTLPQVVLLLITSTFTQVQIQSNLGTTVLNAFLTLSCTVFEVIKPLFCQCFAKHSSNFYFFNLRA